MSTSQPSISFIVPALNEERNLPPLFTRLLALEKSLGVPSEILVIDDASTDGTERVAREAGESHPQIRVYRKPLPHGLGRGLRAGIDRARGKMAIVVMADGVDPLEAAVPIFCQNILQEDCRLVLLSRYMDPHDSKSIPISYKSCHLVFRFLTASLLGIPHPDTTYAFRAFALDFVRRLNLRSEGFEISPEITFKTYFAGGKIGQVAGRQTRRVHGKSNFRFLKAAPGYARVFAEALAMRIGRTRAAARWQEM